MTDSSGTDWDDAFDNPGHIPDSASYPPRWARRASAYRARASHAQLDIPYGVHSRERFDVFHAEAPARGLVVYVHGGFWRRFDKSFWSHLAEGPRQLGWSVAMPSYPLAPEARISAIAESIAEAIATLARRIAGPIRLVGHSAGGHLALRMISEGGPLAPDVASRIERVLSISGVHDLRPLTLTRMNDDLRLSDEEARRESVVLGAPFPGVPVTAWVGAMERPEFIRQSRALIEAWRVQGANIDLHVEPGRHHFDVIDALASAETEISRCLAL